MKMLLIAILFSAFVIAEERNSSKGINVDDNTFKQIYKSNVDQSREEIAKRESLTYLEPSISFAQIQDAYFENSYYKIPYSEYEKSLMLLNIGWSLRAGNFYNFTLDPSFAIGYSYKETIADAQGVSGVYYKDVLTAQWIPLIFSLKINKEIFAIPTITLFAEPGLGSTWVNVAGTLDGIDQNHWINVWGLRAGGVFFGDDPTILDSWFGGVIISAGVQNSFLSDSRLKTVRYDVGIRFYM